MCLKLPKKKGKLPPLKLKSGDLIVICSHSFSCKGMDFRHDYFEAGSTKDRAQGLGQLCNHQ